MRFSSLSAAGRSAGTEAKTRDSAEGSWKRDSSRFHSTRHERGEIPQRWRNRVSSKTGWPGASAGSGDETTDRTDHRVAAVLGRAVAPVRRRNTVTPDRLAASES